MKLPQQVRSQVQLGNEGNTVGLGAEFERVVHDLGGARAFGLVPEVPFIRTCGAHDR